MVKWQGQKRLKRVFKIALIVALAAVIPSVTVYAATVLTLTTPASVTVVLPPTLAIYDYSGTFPSGSCGTTAVTSIPYGSVMQGTSSTLRILQERSLSFANLEAQSFAHHCALFASIFSGTFQALYCALNPMAINSPPIESVSEPASSTSLDVVSVRPGEA